MDIHTNGQDDASLEESAGFENSYPPEEPDTGDTGLLAAAIGPGDAQGEDAFGGVSAYSLQADSADQASDAAAFFGTMPNPQPWSSQGWDDCQSIPDQWSAPHQAEPPFADPAADALAEGAAAFATGDDIADFWANADGGEPFTDNATVVASTWEANTVSWEGASQNPSQDAVAAEAEAPTGDTFADSEVSEASLGIDNDNETVAGSDDWVNWEALSVWAATEKSDGESQEDWAADSAPLDVQEGSGFEKARVLQAQLRVEVEGVGGEESPGPEAESVPEWLTDVGKAGLTGLGLVQELTYPIWKQFEEPQGKPKNFNLSFRDISGFPKPTGQVYINRIDSLTGHPTQWKGLRLDFGPFPPKDPITRQNNIDPATGKKMYKVGWHWNQGGAWTAFGIENHTEIKTGTFPEILGRTLEKAKPLGRAALVGGVFLDAWAMGSAIHTGLHSGEWDPAVVEGARITGGWAGGWAAAQVGGGLGATLGTTILPGVGTIVGGAVGGLAGGAMGYLGGSALGQSAAERATGSPRPQP
ncbi:hypothetical protein [Gloeobacter violaceus]|uniref:Glr1932 protein n=1 Tax=Gloeobacter violaceus (strain ATCC 29082 / PCC 7421) TaxID=251221 RepID=Q7NJA0_GLOVI|nr:hypothetical protein [Gloeobacter violaceus]BAC89873.1 glr1932 [Gloeobacter violaceus PCC 7421]